MLRTLISATIAASIACGSEAVSTADVYAAGNALHYEGEITAERNALTFQLYDEQAAKPSTLLINSPGGDIDQGMSLGEFVFEKGLDVEVRNICLSSCANYVVTAARRLRLDPDAILLWHGGATQEFSRENVRVFSSETGQELTGQERERLLPKLDEFEAQNRRQIARETAFFERLGVDQRVTILGQSEFYRNRYPAADGYVGWDYSIHDLKQLGVRNIEVIGGAHWSPRAPRDGRKLFRVELERTLQSE